MPIITTTDLAAHLGIQDSIDDAQLTTAASAACAQVAAWCDRTFDKTAVGSETARVFTPTSPLLCVVDDFWDVTNLTVRTDDDDTGTYETTWTINTDFVLEPFNGRKHGQSWPYERIVATGNRMLPISAQNRATVQVTAAWGWSAYPAAVVNATLIQAARIFKRRTSPEGVVGGFQDFGAVRVSSRMDPDVMDLLAPYRRASSFGIL